MPLSRNSIRQMKTVPARIPNQARQVMILLKQRMVVTDVKNEKLEFGLTYSILKREFKISGQIGKTGQRDKLTYVALTHQIGSRLIKGYQEHEVVEAIIKSISPHSSLQD